MKFITFLLKIAVFSTVASATVTAHAQNESSGYEHALAKLLSTLEEQQNKSKQLGMAISEDVAKQLLFDLSIQNGVGVQFDGGPATAQGIHYLQTQNPFSSLAAGTLKAIVSVGGNGIYGLEIKYSTDNPIGETGSSYRSSVSFFMTWSVLLAVREITITDFNITTHKNQ